MKKTLSAVLAIVIVCVCIILTGCANPKYNELKDAIKKKGEEIDVDGSTQYSVRLSGDVLNGNKLYYFENGKNVTLSSDEYSNGATVMLSVNIDSKLSGEYKWSASYIKSSTVWRIGGTLYADEITAASVDKAFVEDASQRSGGITTSATQTLLNIVCLLGADALQDFEKFILSNTDLKMSDFGYGA